MSEFKKGDRVKVTIEGVVNTATDWLYINNSSGVYIGEGKLDSDHVHIEKLPDPLPTTPGSVIRVKGTGKLYFRARRDWLNEFGEKSDPSESYTYEVVFDAGAER